MLKILALHFAALLASSNVLQANELKVSAKDFNGIWFRCEFAHSQIPPEDDCRMLDDDGFQVIKGVVHHVKITNSEETNCRHKRLGNCFLKNHTGLEAERSEIGPIDFSARSASVTWLGCTQKYGITRHPNYLDIAPAGELCWWASNKHYFVARYSGPLKIVEEE